MSTTQATLREPDAPRVPFVRRASVDHSGRVLAGRYTLLRRIAAGGSATVYEAAEPHATGPVAIKLLDPGHGGEPAIERFLQEARAATCLRSDHVIDVVDFGREAVERDRELAYIVMERLDGEDLAATLEIDGPLRWTRVLAIAKQVCEALIVAHARGVVHCDIKPGNCFRIARDGTTDFIKVLDFGVASFASKETGLCTPPPGDDRRKSGPVIGTPGYMPDELLRGGPYDHRVDIFALGVLMYRLLTNKMPYAGGGLYVPRRPQSGPCPLRRAAPQLELPEGLEAVILKSVASDPDARYQSAAELLAALEEVERATMPPSRLPDDPLAWGDDDAREASLVARAPSRLPDDPLAWGDEDEGEPTEEEPAAAARSATDNLCRAALSHTELSMTRVAIAVPERRRRSSPHHGLWMLAGFVTSLATTSVVRMLLS